MKRRFRDRLENASERIPQGPLRKTGGGNLVGGAGFLAVESSKPFFDFLPGVKQPGYKITAHSTERANGFVDHMLTVAAIGENVARFAAKYEATPSNIDYLTSETKIIDVELVEKEWAYSIWKITVRVDEFGKIE